MRIESTTNSKAKDPRIHATPYTSQVSPELILESQWWKGKKPSGVSLVSFGSLKRMIRVPEEEDVCYYGAPYGYAPEIYHRC